MLFEHFRWILQCFCTALHRLEKTIYELLKTQKDDSEIQHAQDESSQWG